MSSYGLDKTWRIKQRIVGGEKFRLHPRRGEIQDRNGITLTYSMSTPTIVAIPVQIQDARSVAAKLAEVLQGNEEDIYQQITKKASQNYIKPSGRKITIEKAQEVRNLQLPGIVVAEDNKRYYPFGTLAAHILGFAGIDKGLTGIEAKYNSQLTGFREVFPIWRMRLAGQLKGTTDTYDEAKRRPQYEVDD